MKRNKLEKALDKLVSDTFKLKPGQKRKVNNKFYLIRRSDGTYGSEDIK